MTDGGADDRLYTAPGTGKEAALDLLLAEELATNPGLLDRIARPAFERAGRPLPEGLPDEVLVQFNVWHEVLDGSHGENDLDVRLTWSGGLVHRLLVEDKVWAPLQPKQAERYAGRAAACGGATVLVAPRSWLKGHPAAVALFHGAHAIEDIADALVAEPADSPLGARMRWRSALLRELASPRATGAALDHEPTIAFRDYCTKWLRDNGSSAVVSLPSLHSAGQGWMWFEHPYDLGFKASSGNIDLYASSHGFTGSAEELQALVLGLPLPDGFTVTTDSSKRRNVVIRHTCPKFMTAEGVPADTRALDGALDACKRITEWFDDGGAELLRGGVGSTGI